MARALAAQNEPRYTSGIVPKYLRKSNNVEELLPVLYLKGISTGDFQEALEKILGPHAKGLSAQTKDEAHIAFDIFIPLEMLFLTGFIEEFAAKYPRAVDCLRDHRETLMMFYNYPAEHWKHIPQPTRLSQRSPTFISISSNQLSNKAFTTSDSIVRPYKYKHPHQPWLPYHLLCQPGDVFYHLLEKQTHASPESEENLPCDREALKADQPK